MSNTINLDFSEEYVLEDKVAMLRPLKTNDFDLLLPFSTQEPDLWTYSLQQAAGAEKLKNYINYALTERARDTQYPFLVFDRRVNEVAGCTRFYDIQLQQKTLQLGFTWYGKKFQGTGLNKHCKFLMLQFAFDRLQVERLEFRADYANKRSIAAMQSIGCTVEGVLRSHAYRSDGTRRDSIILSILKAEWNEKVKGNLLNNIREQDF